MSFSYVGTELDVFALADNWKAYYGSFLKPFLAGDVLEVGAGLGATTRALCNGTQARWTCLEPDPSLAAGIAARLSEGALPACCRVVPGDVASLAAADLYDAILYVDVLEHIENDRAELAAAARHLKPGGRLAVLSPAHAWLYTPFDAAIGHHRRYTKATLAAAAPPGLETERLDYLDAAGLFLSLSNRLLLRSAHPTAAQILFWDRRVIPVSRVLDRVLARKAGKSVLGIWRRPGTAATLGSPANRAPGGTPL
jgi:SAM-dependent methyltransferase